MPKLILPCAVVLSPNPFARPVASSTVNDSRSAYDSKPSSAMLFRCASVSKPQYVRIVLIATASAMLVVSFVSFGSLDEVSASSSYLRAEMISLF
jgi:hypothetical protein